MSRRISQERKTAYYLGMGLTILGFLMFLSSFATSVMHFGDFSHFEARTKSGATRAFGGIVLIVIGRLVSRIGARGLAGSGTVLDPEQAREDLEPYSRMAGGILKDTLDEADVHIGGRSEKVIMIKCAACGRLNEEDSKFCQECGRPI